MSALGNYALITTGLLVVSAGINYLLFKQRGNAEKKVSELKAQRKELEFNIKRRGKVLEGITKNRAEIQTKIKEMENEESPTTVNDLIDFVKRDMGS